MSTATDRQTFRETLAQVAEQARALLPLSVNGRLESAVKLVLAGDVFFLDNGTVEVGSASDPTQVHVLTGTCCDCADYPRAPESWCKHRIAANLQRSVERVLARCGPPAPEVVEMPEVVEPYPDNDLEGAPEPVPVPSAPPSPSLPEAPASVNVRVTIGGREVQWTLRDSDEARLAVRLEALLARYPLPQVAPEASRQGQPLSPQPHHAAAMHRPVSGVCAVHHVEMKLNQKDGRQWYSHYDEQAGRWCKGR
jgi:hypothetical protein